MARVQVLQSNLTFLTSCCESKQIHSLKHNKSKVLNFKVRKRVKRVSELQQRIWKNVERRIASTDIKVMASIVLKVSVFCSLKKKQISERRKIRKTTNGYCGLNFGCVSFVGKPILNNTKEINEGEYYHNQTFWSFFCQWNKQMFTSCLDQ